MKDKMLNFYDSSFKTLLDHNDMTSYYRCQQLVKYWNLSEKFNISGKSLAIILYFIINIAVILYEYVYASWFLLYITPNGFRVIKKLIYSNPIFTVFFYLSFYIRILTETDIEKFNYISKKLGLPEYDVSIKLTTNIYIYKFINN